MRTVNLILISSFLTACGMNNQTNDSTQKLVEQPDTELFRPAYHFTPPKNWMNDPNGMVYYQGEFHLFYQHNPGSSVWGPMHWGHAISKDMVHWEHQEIKLYPDEHGTIFSGSAVVDWQNSSGFGSKENPPLVAMYTYHDEEKAAQGAIDFQTQGLAYSVDKGRTWQKYENNPVLKNPGIRDFRDPKVNWHEPTQQWTMVLAQDDHIGFYTSKNLKDWQFESNFGLEWGSHAGVWECPDLIRVKVEGTDQYKYVLLVSINPGAPNGGSGTQYFVGDFDGNQFTLDEEYQQKLASTPAAFPKGLNFSDFKNGLSKWQVTGNAFHVENDQQGNAVLSSFNQSDKVTGTILSQPFTINHDYINFKIAGGKHENSTVMQLLINGEIVKSAKGDNSGNMVERAWDVSNLKAKQGQIKIIDTEEGDWGHVKVADITFSDEAAKAKVEPSIWLDYGTDNYAGVTFSDTQENRHLFMGWMSNWQYANVVPTTTWRSAMTIPRELKLVDTPQGIRVASEPVKELQSVLSEPQIKAKLTGKNSYQLDELFNIIPGQFKFSFNFINDNQAVDIILSADSGEQTVLTLDPVKGVMTLDRTQAGLSDFEPGFASIQTGPLDKGLKQYDIEVWVDKASIEVFVNQGIGTMTSIIFPTQAYHKVNVNAAQEVSLSEIQLNNIVGNN
ncbi:glycoside hydrolase family 32 protein [Pseudoalteromonas sp. SR44-2]|uniref:glycoside hydrolase family 32 protein n=1 Tax=Pseudoalteromonas sp. SR44-2 TaxID=2760937 RepID=UPI0016028508|nr:glycoside hydrolase family 32 protein [Pseudoalteromonas sp. SR44-2]MBB1339433.1 glycoside hydrolase family 32 protein [Pseudoalteromonas sp. SR44-2]